MVTGIPLAPALASEYVPTLIRCQSIRPSICRRRQAESRRQLVPTQGGQTKWCL